MDDQVEPIGGDDMHQAPAAIGAPYGRPPSWVIVLGTLLVAVAVFGPQRPASIVANGDRATGSVKRGKQTLAPSQIPGQGWKAILLGAYHGISEDRILLVAAGVTFYAILALFPGIGAIVSVYGLFADPSRIVTHLDTLSGFAPSRAASKSPEPPALALHSEITMLMAKLKPSAALS
jgi:membrane protein